MIGNHTLTVGEAKLLRFKFDKSWIFKYLGQFLREETICTKAFLVPLLCRYSATKKHSYFTWMDFESGKREEAGHGLEGVPYLRIPCVDLSGGDAHFFPVSDLQYKYLSIIHGVVVVGGCDWPDRHSEPPQLTFIYLFIFIWSKQNITSTLLIINGSNYQDHLTHQPSSHICFYY